MADPGTLYAFAHQFYWDFRRIAEGTTRQQFDKAEFEKRSAEIDKMELELSPEQRANLEGNAKIEIESGRLEESKKAEWMSSAADAQLAASREWLRKVAADESTREVSIPGEPEAIAELLQARTPARIHEICKDAFSNISHTLPTGERKEFQISNWPISSGSVLPTYLSQYASEFIAAKKDPRFPRSTRRPTSRLKQLWFVSRALAGALYGISTRTAINLVGSIRPEEAFAGSRASKPLRKQKVSRRKSKK
jgi:hypothetical protein